jgi:hypothetical protein
MAGWYARKTAETFAGLIEPGVAYDEVQIMAMEKEALKGADQYSGERMDTGTVAHKWIEKHIRQGIRGSGPGPQHHSKILNPNVRRSVEAFLEWEHDVRPRWIHAERLVYSVRHGHCGTIDGVALVRDRGVQDPEAPERLLIVDFKTGKGVWAEAGLQTASYVAAFLEEHPQYEPAQAERLVLHIPAFSGNGSAKVWDEQRISEKLTGHTWQQDYEVFLGLLTGWHWIMNGPNRWAFFGK